MTPRLKKLLVGFAISLVILVSDRLSESSSDSTVKEKVKKRARTAKIGSNRTKRFKEQAAREAKRLAPKDYTPSQEFISIPEDVHALADWGRNPFTDGKSTTPVRLVNQPVKSEIVREEVIVSNVNALKIESVATLGDKTFVIINGHRYQEGDNIDNMIIETIESKRIIFKSGAKTIVKNVGS